jgi:phosphatidylglycerol:prolipoprotein diacylglycerol transferase
MTFPVYLTLGPWRLHPHLVFEVLAYTIGFQIFLWLRRRGSDPVARWDRWFVVAAAVLGAALGSKLLYLLADPVELAARWRDVSYLLGGKTVVGGLIGGLIAVEWTKRQLDIRVRTGDLFAIPIAAGIAVGRIGCFLTGLPDRTYGVATVLPWGIDFGDGVARHPTQLYEIVFLVGLIVFLVRTARRPRPSGDVFKIFMVAYFAFRLGVDFMKPGVPLAGLTALQWGCVAVLLYYGRDIRRWAAAGMPSVSADRAVS